MTDIREFYPNNETGLERACVELLRVGSLHEVMGWPPIKKINRQVRMGKAIADILIEHADGTITVIEVKAPSSLRDYCTGVGQLAYQGLLAMLTYQVRDVRRVLATPGPISLDLMLTCDASGVDILPLMTVAEWHEMLAGAEIVRG